MAEFTPHDRTVGYRVLAAIFALGGIGAAVRAWRLLMADGLDLRSAIWLLAVLGFVSLAWRYARAARVGEPASRPS